MPIRDPMSVEFQETGSGPTVLFVPGSFATSAAWRGLQKRLPAGYRMVSTSLCGYGATVETRTLADPDMAHQLRVIEAAAARAGGPVHLVGHSFGGTIALASALAGTVEIRSVATFEANPLALIGNGDGDPLFEETRRMSAAFEAAYHAGEADAAGRIIDFWGGEGAFAALPEVVRDYCRSTAWSNVLDWRTAFGFRATRADYATLGIPVLLVRGEHANPAMVAITDALERSLPDVRSAVVAGAGHFLITTHAPDCARLLSDFLADGTR